MRNFDSLCLIICQDNNITFINNWNIDSYNHSPRKIEVDLKVELGPVVEYEIERFHQSYLGDRKIVFVQIVEYDVGKAVQLVVAWMVFGTHLLYHFDKIPVVTVENTGAFFESIDSFRFPVAVGIGTVVLGTLLRLKGPLR
ncbi:hypothetical protein WICMUC_000473 [Wickerhamomyces mucosus]|uniref:Uncharacterized protein n=1 Tax=Wickerhamomyces mucosus TaxID=1378264 RepID=A0A9P8THX0_9ASCO|nr:hypothetical protein WICMUC_000473 [Wickerhamomyces mucosus]